MVRRDYETDAAVVHDDASVFAACVENVRLSTLAAALPVRDKVKLAKLQEPTWA